MEVQYGRNRSADERPCGRTTRFCAGAACSRGASSLHYVEPPAPSLGWGNGRATGQLCERMPGPRSGGDSRYAGLVTPPSQRRPRAVAAGGPTAQVAEQPVRNTPDDRGHRIDTVTVAIDYAIIQHFSEHLYGSPNKAVEELVANSYDAWATRSYVYLPGAYAPNALLVWDDGESMDLADLHKLWWIAKSPKDDGSNRVEERKDRGKRALIGKFGIGKLASYSLGHRITHLVRRDKKFLRVTVDYRGVPELTEGTEQPRYETPVVELTEKEAKEYVGSLTVKPLRAQKDLWAKKRWTLAIIDELKPDIDLQPGRLRWVLANGMPYRPDFSVVVDDTDLVPRLAKGAFKTWTTADKVLQQRIEAEWADAKKDGVVSGDITFVTKPEPAVIFPNLGSIRAEVRLFAESMFKGRGADLDRSYGFFVMVRERLLNPDDPLLLMHDPSYGTFYRTQYVIYADGLDADLLADRERVQRQSPMTEELAVLQGALYRAARQELTERDESVELARRSESLLPIESREHFQDPMTALLLANDLPAIVDPRTALIERAPLSVDASVAVFRPESGGFTVNVSHPLFAVLSERLGGGAKAKEALRAFDLLAVADRLLEGHLYDVGLEPDEIAEVMAWREGLLRSIASKLTGARDSLIHEVREASYLGDKPFEQALQRLFAAMGFVATRDGLSGMKDVLVIAPIGEGEYRFTIEAKGSKHAVGNADADISGAAAHAEEAEAGLAVVVAREFAGFDRPRGRPAVLKECDATKGLVSIASVDVLAELFEAMRTYSYPLDMVHPVLSIVESPAEKLARVKALQHPTDAFDFRGVLEAIWDQQKGTAAGDLVAYRSVMQSRSEWKALGFEEFERRVLALQTLSRGLMLVTRSRAEVVLKQSPDIVATQIARSLDEQSAG